MERVNKSKTSSMKTEKTKQQHIRHTVYYKNGNEKDQVEQATKDRDITASKLIYKLLKNEGII